MNKQEKVKRIRFAANSMVYENGGLGIYTIYSQKNQHISTTYSCNALSNLDIDVADYNDLFEIRTDLPEIIRGRTQQTQLQRALMLDLYAEMIECGDEK